MSGALKQSLQQFLTAAPALAAGKVLVFPMRLPEKKTRPALDYELVSCVRPGTLEGQSRLAHARVRVTCHGGGDGPYAQAADLADQVRAIMTGTDPDNYGAGFPGEQTYLDTATQTQKRITVRSCLCEDEADVNVVPGNWGEDKPLQNAVALDFMLWHLE